MYVFSLETNFLPYDIFNIKSLSLVCVEASSFLSFLLIVYFDKLNSRYRVLFLLLPSDFLGSSLPYFSKAGK